MRPDEIPPIGGIIVAAGASTRFGKTDKQLALLDNLPVLIHSLRRFLPLVRQMVVAVPQGREMEFEHIARDYGCQSSTLSFIPGGTCRTESVKAALARLDEACTLVAIHDAARPLVSQTLFLELAETAWKLGGAVPGIPMTDTVLRTDSQNTVVGACQRDALWRVATPQSFRLKELLDAYAAAGNNAFTDDAQVFQHNGGTVKIVPASENELMKITFPDDLERARIFLEKGR